jgi:hypothetical protein
MVQQDPPSEPPVIVEPKRVLEEVRTKSCYGALRAVINVGLIFILIACVIFALIGIYGLANLDQFAKYGSSPDEILGGFIGILFGSIVGMILGFAWRQASFAVIDIADLLIAQRVDWKISRTSGCS